MRLGTRVLMRKVPAVVPALGACIALLGVIAAPADATNYQHPFKGVFGSAVQPSFSWPKLLAIDPASGDLLVGNNTDPNTGVGEILRFKPNGEPDPFPALGSNAIDGKAGADQTPQGGLEVGGSLAQEIAIDNSGGPTDGDIYITQPAKRLVDIFSAEGRYLGQLTATRNGALKEPDGVAVDPDGDVYLSASEVVGTHYGIAKFVPSANPPVNSDNTALFPLEHYETLVHLVAGLGSSAGSLFVSATHHTTEDVFTPETLKMNEETGEFTEFAKGFRGTATIDPLTGNPILQSNTNQTEASEFDGSGPTAGSPLSILRVEGHGPSVGGIAANGSEVFAVTGPADPRVFAYGEPAVVATVTAEAAGNVSGTKATLRGSVNPSGISVSDCFFEWGPTVEYGHKEPCEGSIPTDSEDHPAHVRISGLTPNGATYHFRLGATDENGTEYSLDQSFTTAATLVTKPATEVGLTAATLNGTLRPEGHEYTECSFSWGLASSASFEHTAPCSPTAAEIEPAFTAQEVSAPVGELQPGTAYRFRLVATSSGPEGTREGEEETFTTLGPPQLREVRALDATQDSALLEAKIDPRGFHTTYRFEWGPTAAYGNVTPPKFEPSVGEGTSPVLVTAGLSGLAPATTYHYRVVATSSAGTTTGPDRELETLDGCGLPDGRCFEMVSRRDAGLSGQPGRYLGLGRLEHAAEASSAPGLLAYSVEGGYSDATKGAEVLYLASRGEDGWESSQLSPPVSRRDEQQSSQAQPSEIYGLSHELSCGVAGSNQPLTSDPAADLIVEAGAANLYRINPDGSYTLVTDVPPEELKSHGNIHEGEFSLVGESADCGTVVFATQHHYSGVPGVGTSRLYEWDEAGGLRTVGWIPGASGEQMAAASASGSNAVSEDGSRVFFSATRVIAGNPSDPGEAGKTGLFVREDGSSTRDVSASETATPDTGATFEGATPDGSRVYFTANAGLTAASNSTGTDLYEYDLEAEALTDLTVTSQPGGANVRSVAVSEDGSHAYFTSRSQLVPGRGRTRAQNESGKTESLYDAHAGTISFVASGGIERFSDRSSEQSSRIGADGRYLLFEATGNVTGYESSLPEAYLYDAEAGSEATVCVSCRQDGKPTLDRPPLKGPVGFPLAARNGPEAEPQTLVIRDGEPEVFFRSRDRLADGGAEGEFNEYEWAHDQVFHIASEVPGTNGEATGRAFVEFFGASLDGTDLYLATAAALNWENPGERPAVWDARVNGGFPEPPPPAAPCDPDADGSCQGAATQPAAPPSSATASFDGPGNVKSPPKKPAKKHKKKGKKHKKKGGKSKRHAKSNRRAAK
jgi:hypothetical protein